jgi:hypothetical protein
VGLSHAPPPPGAWEEGICALWRMVPCGALLSDRDEIVRNGEDLLQHLVIAARLLPVRGPGAGDTESENEALVDAGIAGE